MKVHLLLFSATAALLIGWPCAARADYHSHRYTRVYVYSRPPLVRVRPRWVAPPPRWTLGMHLTAATTNQKLGDEGVDLGGIGGHLRYRGGYRWGAELAVDVLGRELADGAIQRVSVPVQASAMLYLLPRGALNVYLLGGFRVVPTHIRWDLSNLQTDQTFTEFGMQGGAGGELLLGRLFALTADVRVFGTMRYDDEPAGAFYAGAERPVLPEKTTGVQFSVGGGFRF